MTDITAAPNIIQVEEVAFRAGISESTFNRMGASINYIINRVLTPLEFDWPGRTGNQTEYETSGIKERVLLDSEIVGWWFQCDNTGNTGNTIINFNVYDEDGVLQGTLFSTGAGRPLINGNNQSKVIIGRDNINNVDIETNEGGLTAYQIGTLNLTTLSKGDYLVPFFDGVAVKARDVAFRLITRHS